MPTAAGGMGGGVHRETGALGEGVHREAGALGGGVPMRRGAQGGGVHGEAGCTGGGPSREGAQVQDAWIPGLPLSPLCNPGHVPSPSMSALTPP